MNDNFGPLGYRLEQELVSPEKLILHPRNPRLTASESDYFCEKDADYTQAWVQNDIKKELSTNPSHGLNGLIKSIKVNGFLDINSIVVKKYRGNYLVFTAYCPVITPACWRSGKGPCAPAWRLSGHW